MKSKNKKMQLKKNLPYFLLLLVALLFATYWGYQSNHSVNQQSIFGGSNNTLTEFQKDIVKKIRAGNMVGLSEYFDDEVSLTLFEESDFYLRAEAEQLLSEFCQNHTTKKFLVKHYGANKLKTSFYLIGELRSTEQEKYRVYISNYAQKIEAIEITLPREGSVQ